ncbi:voltage-gated chloride channel family protein [Pedobacter sp. KR3-3]|uniref:Voltage-gated chloride channel family protein n=1 Tax=Pedobacter albus TaxID=3113905 RepID=A0ABU7ICA4_9SPHI|nr:voltage-gated chloride channel family protein [Pedobacter sp. KR3-3]MEE1947002.1 voltage-gated chloride channel family protein [Pedobacter sp. KR3-3]
MPFKTEKTISKKTSLQFRLFFRKYPTVPYLLKWLFICALIGILVGSASAGFLQSLNWVTTYRENHIWLIALLPLAGLLIGLLYHYYGKDVEAGNNLLIQTYHRPQQTIPFKMAPFVYLGTLATHLFGGSAGREGTALQMAGALSDQLSKPFKLNAGDRQTLLVAAVAAGFGSVFGTPLAGAIFGLELFLIGKLKYDTIFPAFMAALLADLTTQLWQVHHTTYQMDHIPHLALLPIGYALLAGLAFGLCAAGFSKLMHLASAVFKKFVKYPPLRPVVGGLMVAVAVWTLGTTQYIGLGIPTIVNAFETPLGFEVFALKMAFTIVTLAAGFKGGEVTPLFFIGAALGSALSFWLPLPVGLMAGMGFVAVFAGATNTPLACTVMAMELFGSDCGVYVALACVTAYLISGNTGIYRGQVIGEAKHIRYKFYNNKRLEEL